MARRLKEAKDQKKLLMRNVLCCTTPENSLREMIDSLLDLIKEFFDVERVGIFVIDKVHSVMSLRRSMDEEGLELVNDDNDSTSDLEVAARSRGKISRSDAGPGPLKCH